MGRRGGILDLPRLTIVELNAICLPRDQKCMRIQLVFFFQNKYQFLKSHLESIYTKAALDISAIHTNPPSHSTMSTSGG